MRAHRASCPAHGRHAHPQSPQGAMRFPKTHRPSSPHRTPSHHGGGAWDAKSDHARQTAWTGDAALGRIGPAPRTDARQPAARPPHAHPQHGPQRHNRHSIPRMSSPRSDRHVQQQMPSRLFLSSHATKVARPQLNKPTIQHPKTPPAQQQAPTPKKPPARQRPAGGPTSNRRYLTPRTSWRR